MMQHSGFQIGTEFVTGNGSRWRCTDIGSRTIIAIRLEPVELTVMKDGEKSSLRLTQAEAEREGWFLGPPYKVAETVFDEDDLEDCEPVDKAFGLWRKPREPGALEGKISMPDDFDFAASSEEWTLDRIGQMVQALSDRFDRLENAVDRLDAQITAVELRVTALEASTESLFARTVALEDRLTQWIDRLENAVR